MLDRNQPAEPNYAQPYDVIGHDNGEQSNAQNIAAVREFVRMSITVSEHEV